MRSLDLSQRIPQLSAAEWQQLQTLEQTRRQLAGRGINYFFKATPLGPLLVVYGGEGLTALEFGEGPAALEFPEGPAALGTSDAGLTALEFPEGPAVLGTPEAGLTALEFIETKDSHKLLRQIVAARPGAGLHYDGDHPLARRISAQLDDYFSGTLRQFTLPLWELGTDFQRRVWRCLRTIGYGETISYGEESRRLGQPRAVRAVAAANGRNKISIVVPCHRVIASNGQLHGYGGGLERKAALLQLEQGQAIASGAKWQALNGLLRN